jgi:hypothetical protein
MATTTNFGWTTPDDTALVKDGASAIRSLGSSVDSALGQLTLNAQTATYTAVLTDNRNKLVTMSVSTANDFLIPTNANVAFPVGSVINVIQIGTGQTTIKAVTSGTTTISSTGAVSTAPVLRARYSAATCIKVATDTWYVVGDIA